MAYRYKPDNDLLLTFTKPQLLARLQEMLPACREFDKKMTAEHKAKEQANWVKWKKDCAVWNRRMQAMSLKGYKSLGDRPSLPKFEREFCPDSRAARARRWIELVKASGRTRYQIGQFDPMYEVLTLDAPKVKDVC